MTGILLLTKSIFAVMIGFLSSVLLGLFLIPVLKRLKVGQRISIFVGDSHKKKAGTPTMGGLIFIIPTFTDCISTKLTTIPSIPARYLLTNSFTLKPCFIQCNISIIITEIITHIIA